MNYRVLYSLAMIVTALGEEDCIAGGVRHGGAAQCSAYVNDNLYTAASSELYNPCPGHPTGLAGEAFTDLINTLIVSGCVLAPPCTYPRDIGGECRDKEEYDFVVVGGGTAGSVIAARLSEVANWTVMLLEAGGDPPMSTEIPFYSLNLQKTDIDWSYTTTKEKGLFNGIIARRNRWPRGRVLGGSSSIGTMLYARGSQRDFDNMAADGNQGWSYSDVLPYFNKTEDMRDVDVLGNTISSFYHSQEGPLTLSRFSVNDEAKEMIDIVQRAGLELGCPSNFDLNGVTMTGFTYPNQGTIKDGERVNSAKAFLNPVKNRKNLFVIKHAKVHKVLIDKTSKRAYGVEYFYKNERVPRVIRANREVIVSAGTVSSPKILMLSGIGPMSDLSLIGIDVIQDLQVGKNLYDHVMFPGMLITMNTGHPEMSSLDLLDEAYEYLTRRRGMLASIGASALVGHINMDDEDQPDIMLRFIHGVLNDTEIIPEFYKALGIEDNLLFQILKIVSKGQTLIPIPAVLHPRSLGRISLRSPKPDDPPEILTNYMDNSEDLEYMLMGIRFVEKLVATAEFKKYNATLNYLNYSGCCGLDYGTDAYWSCALSHIASTAHDQGGTCKMGPETDPDAVVDPELMVYGVKGLRVADASIFPKPMTGGTLATAILAGEKVSDLIKNHWLNKKQESRS